MAKRRTRRFPKWAKIMLWIFGVAIALVVILCIALQIWIMTWKIYRINGVSIKTPMSWDVRDTGGDLNKGEFISGYRSVMKAGDSSTEPTQGPDDISGYKGKVLIYVFRDEGTGVYYTQTQTSGNLSIAVFYHKFLSRLVASTIEYPLK